MNLNFGKYKGFTVAKVAEEGEEGVQYLEWLRENTDTAHKKYGKKNAELVAEINRVLRDQGQANPKPALAKPSNGQALNYLREMSETLKRIEEILANPGRVHVTKEELNPDEEAPF